MIKLNEPIIQPIFPTPLYINKLNGGVSKDYLDYINKLETYKNLNNKTSVDTYILNQKLFTDLKNELHYMLGDYYKQVIGRDDLEPYITQSWINFTESGESHHRHKHNNSIVSGVVFLNANIDHDKITFCKENTKVFDLVGKPNLFTCEEIDLSVGKNYVVLFPSYLEHRVKKTVHDDTRISLSFNSFTRGILGNQSDLTELKIN